MSRTERPAPTPPELRASSTPASSSHAPDAPDTDTADDADGNTRIADAVRSAIQRERDARLEPEPTLGSRLGQIGLLGWTIVIPTLCGLAAGHWLDRQFGTGVFFAAPMLMIGAVVGLWLAWKWMHRQTGRN